jgi:hypothetical protein
MKEQILQSERKVLIGHIIQNLEFLPDTIIKDLYFLSNSPSKFLIYDIYEHSLISIPIYHKLKDKYPEEFI